jgi:hypothetical protein
MSLAAVHESLPGTSRTLRNVRFLVAIRCKPDTGQAASSTLYFTSTTP